MKRHMDVNARRQPGTKLRYGSVCVALALAEAASAQVTSRVSVDSAGAQGNADSYPCSISGDGRYVAFFSFADDLVAGDTNTVYDAFVRDRLLGTTERVSVDSAGVEGNDSSINCSISADGRYVAFESLANNLVAGDTNVVADIFVHDRQTGATERVSVDSAGAQGNDYSLAPSISSDGRFVVFISGATNLVAGDSNLVSDIFVRDRQNGTTERVSVGPAGVEGNGYCYSCSISVDGRTVAFQSYSDNLVAGDTNALGDVFVRDRQLGTTERVSVGPAGLEGDGDSNASLISADGRYAVFASYADNLVPGDTNGSLDVFLRDRQNGTTERVSVDSAEAEVNGASFPGSITPGGRYVAFQSFATDLVSGDTNGFSDVFVRDRANGTAELVSVDSAGAQGNGDSYFPLISADGRVVAFYSSATDLVAGDTNGTYDAFVHDRAYSPMTSLCDPGMGGVIACPCSNPPGALGRGCDNSSATGGAILSASGIGYLSQDTLVFTTTGEKPTATSIVLQGTAQVSAGVTYGQGVRCVGGTLKRLFVKAASGGSITAPDFGAGDPSVSVRSAARGDVIGAGQSRFYLVYYRDPVVLGGCPPSRTFNATQTGEVTWWP
ncbi:MAG TPA: hypothetical protein VGR31_16030 [Planctomycetota bacterium]|jgi:Tol biopolymer transport system component|nr:hypothetical protein [Planctomycetota bacterium]